MSLLEDLVLDADLRRAFEHDREAVLASYDLDPKAFEALAEGSREVLALLGAELPAAPAGSPPTRAELGEPLDQLSLVLQLQPVQTPEALRWSVSLATESAGQGIELPVRIDLWSRGAAVDARINPHPPTPSAVPLGWAHDAELKAGASRTEWPTAPLGPADIEVVGLGITSVDHITQRAEQLVREADVVLFLDAAVGVESWLRARNERVESLYTEVYEEGRDRRVGYRHLVDRVLEATQHGRVVLAIAGHPTVGVYAPFLLRDAAKQRGLSVRAHAGISSLDTLFADCWLDPFLRGFYLVEATDLFLRRRPLLPDVPTAIVQLGNLGTLAYSREVVPTDPLESFAAYLACSYGPDATALLYFASPHPAMQPVIQPIRVADLPSYAREIHPGVTVVLPPTGERAIVDSALAASLTGAGEQS